MHVLAQMEESMTAKEYLLEIHKSRRILHTLEQRSEELRTQAEGLKAIVYDKEKVQVSPSNTMEEVIIKLVEVEEEYGRQIVRYHTEMQRRIDQIAAMRPDYAEILRLRYIEGNGRPLRLEEIALRMHLSWPRVKHLHGEALEAFRRKWL